MCACNVPYSMSPMCVNNLNNVFSVFTLCFVKTSEVGYWKRMMVMHEDVCNHWLGAGCREEIRTRVPSVSPCHTPCLRLFKQDLATEGNVLSMSLKYNFSSERNPIISLLGQRRLFRQRQQRTHSQWWMQWPVFPTSNMSIGPDSKYDKSTMIEAGV